jgi:hypothetical protein
MEKVWMDNIGTMWNIIGIWYIYIFIGGIIGSTSYTMIPYNGYSIYDIIWKTMETLISLLDKPSMVFP